MREMCNMQQNIKECLIILTVIRLQEIRNKQMHRSNTIRILNSTVKVSLISYHSRHKEYLSHHTLYSV